MSVGSVSMQTEGHPRTFRGTGARSTPALRERTTLLANAGSRSMKKIEQLFRQTSSSWVVTQLSAA